MRDLVVMDLGGDGTMEIITATAGGLVVCFDHQLQQQWVRAMPAGPTAVVVGLAIR